MKTVKKRSQKQEKSVAKSFNAKTTVASGALWGAKGDVRNDKFLIECKTTTKTWYSLTAKTWEKIEQEAIRDHMRIPLMVIDLEDKDRVVVFRMKDFSDVPVRVMLPNKKDKGFSSCRISASNLGYNDQKDYIRMRVFVICGEKENVLCSMLQKDFEESFKEELQ